MAELKKCSYASIAKNETILTSLFIDSLLNVGSMSKFDYELIVKSLGKQSLILARLSAYVGIDDKKSLYFFKLIVELTVKYLMEVEKRDKTAITSKLVLMTLCGRKYMGVGSSIVGYGGSSDVKHSEREAWRLVAIKSMDYDNVWNDYNAVCDAKNQQIAELKAENKAKKALTA